jgi:pyruvate ferredoxin oxidoreductase alpha subunit
VLGITSFRPFPMAQVREALTGVRRVVVLEKAFSVGIGGIVSSNLRAAVEGLPLQVRTVIAGLGGRPITTMSLHTLLDRAGGAGLEPLEFLDLDHGLVDRELARQLTGRCSGPAAENMLRDVGGRAER